MSMLKSLKLIWFTLLPFTCVLGQDIHFSQFDVFNSTVSPAFTGVMDETYRFSAINRTQWKSVTIPYQTFGLNIEAAKPFKIKGLGVGLSFITDKSGDSNYQENIFGFAASYALKNANYSINFGANFSLVQQQIDFSQLRFDRQYNGFIFDPSLSNNENFNVSQFTYTDLAFGGLYTQKISSNFSASFAFGLYNLLNNQVSFFDNGASTKENRIAITAQAKYIASHKIEILPSIIWSAQNTYRETIIGGRLKYNTENAAVTAIYGGVYGRAKDALNLVAGMDYRKWYGGLSYDLNLSSLRVASNVRGGIEVVLVYKISKFHTKFKQHKSCPVFI